MSRVAAPRSTGGRRESEPFPAGPKQPRLTASKIAEVEGVRFHYLNSLGENRPKTCCPDTPRQARTVGRSRELSERPTNSQEGD